MITTLGRELIREALPAKHKDFADTVWTKSATTKMMTTLAAEDPDAYIDLLQKLNAIGQVAVSQYGRDAALPYSSIGVSKELKAVNKQLRQVIKSILNDKKLTSEQKEQKIIELGYKYTQKVEDAVFDSNDKRSTALASQINSGSRGSKTQLRQMQFGNMLMKDALNRDMPYVMLDPYISGASPMSYWVSASSGRKGFFDVQMATGRAGYLGKQVTAATHDCLISEKDCGTTDTGIPFPADSAKNIGAMLLKPWKGYKAGTIVTEKMVSEAKEGDEMILRSPCTCKSRVGVCAYCNGLAEDGKFPGIGAYVSMNAARSYVEPITQSGVASKHSGGVGGKKVIDPEGEDQPAGFKSVERMLRVPSNFPGGAVLAPVDGTISSIKPAPQGGTYVTVGEKTVYCSPYRTIKSKVGDRVYAGDVLTNGVPNPLEVVHYKGLGNGRRYFIDKFTSILKDAKAGTDRRNVESFTRALISKVRITDPDGYKAWLPGDVADYNEIAADWKPREGSFTSAPSKALNTYLEQPALYYSVGTRVTPEVADTLKKYNFDEVTVHKDAPPFEPEFLRPATVIQYSKNWLPRLAGERLKESLFTAARQGITDAYDSPSYVDRVVAAPFKPQA